MAVIAWGLLKQSVAESIALAADPDTARRWQEASQAAGNVLWLAAGAIGAALLGVATVLTRSWVIGDLERLDRAITRDARVAGDDEIARVSRRITELQADVKRLEGAQSAGLAAVSGYRTTLADVAEQLVVADRLALTGQLSLGVAHEIGGQLAVAQMALDMTAADPALSEEERGEMLADVQQAVGRIDTIVRDINRVGLSRAPAKASPACDVAQAIDQARRLAQLHRRAKHMRCDLAQPEQAVAHIAMDATRLEQILLNLLLNAADAMQGGGATRISWGEDEGGVWVDVEDDGPGVPNEARPRIFEPFMTTKGEGEGSGLGLSVSRQLLDAIGGSLQVADATVLSGARFTIRAPKARLSPS